MISRAALDTAPPPLEPLAVDANRAASLCGVSVHFWWAHHSSGCCPLPFRLGRAVRWRTDALRAWLSAGCPSRDSWRAMQAGSDGR